MKKVLPVLTLLSYLIAVVVCIVKLIRGDGADLTTIIIFLVYIVGVIVLMSFFTASMVKKKRGQQDEPEEEADEEPLEDAADEASEEDEDADDEDEDDHDIVIVAAADSSEDDDEDEEDDEDEDDDEDEEDDENDPSLIILPIGSDDDDDDDDEDSRSERFAKSRYTRTYAARLIQSSDELKGYYSIVKNAFMSYKKVSCTVSREYERIRRGRTTIGIIKVRGKTLLVYLALDPKELENTMYIGEDVSDVAKYAAVPFLYRVKGPRKADRTVRLIGMIAEKMGLEPTDEPANEDYVARFAYESTEALIEKGLIIDNVAEAERKAEEARLAAEEAEAAAQKAIEDAIKAKEHADMVSERSERTVDEIEAAEEAKAAKAAEADAN